MKRVERHRLKENEVALSVERARETFEEHQREILFGAVAVVAMLAIVGGYLYWRSRVDSSSRALLTEAMAVADAQVVPATPPAPPGGTAPASTTPPPAPPPGSYPTERAKLEAALPKFMAAANAYPSTPSGIAARYHAAATLMALNRPTEAIQRYKEVVERAGNTLYADVARLGLADAETAAKQYDAAIARYRELAIRKDGNIPVDGVLMQLARAYQLAGKKTEAVQTFKRIVEEYPDSGYAQTAKKEVDSAKTTTP